MMGKYLVNKNIKRIMQASHCTAGSVARKAGMSPSVMSNIARCKRKVYADEVIPLARALQVSIEDLFQVEN